MNLQIPIQIIQHLPLVEKKKKYNFISKSHKEIYC